MVSALAVTESSLTNHSSAVPLYDGFMRLPWNPLRGHNRNHSQGVWDRSQGLVWNLSDTGMRYLDGTTALEGITCRISAPLTVVLGLNGSGKTTLLRLLSARLAPSSGRLDASAFNGSRTWMMAKSRDRRSVARDVAFVGVDGATGMNADASVASAVERLVRSRYPRGEDAGMRTADILRLCLLSDHRERPVSSLDALRAHEFSIAVALAENPRLIVLDEPTRGLEGPQARTISQIIMDCGRQIILSTHDLDLAASFDHPDNRALVLDSGHLIGIDGVADGLQLYRETIEARLKGSVPPACRPH